MSGNKTLLGKRKIMRTKTEYKSKTAIIGAVFGTAFTFHQAPPTEIKFLKKIIP